MTDNHLPASPNEAEKAKQIPNKIRETVIPVRPVKKSLRLPNRSTKYTETMVKSRLTAPTPTEAQIAETVPSNPAIRNILGL